MIYIQYNSNDFKMPDSKALSRSNIFEEEKSASRANNRSHSLATTYQLQQEKLRKQQLEEEDKK